jgi:MYXO-CTERM domain-containing protein
VQSSRSARLAFVGASVLALLALVGLASRGGLGGGGRGPGPSQGLVDYAFTVFLVAYVLMVPFALWAFLLQQKRERERPERKQKGSRLLANVFAFALLLLAALAIERLRHAGGLGPHAPQVNTAVPTSTFGRSSQAESGPQFQWPVVVVTAVLALAALAAFLVVRRRRGKPAGPRSVAADISAVLEDALADVRAERDPRRAVIKAYARMESVLAAHGLPRDPAEAPYEFLARTLEELDASGESVRRLTDLFERAKFSTHEIDERMREEAIAALTAVRDELQGTTELAA